MTSLDVLEMEQRKLSKSEPFAAQQSAVCTIVTKHNHCSLLLCTSNAMSKRPCGSRLGQLYALLSSVYHKPQNLSAQSSFKRAQYVNGSEKVRLHSQGAAEPLWHSSFGISSGTSRWKMGLAEFSG